MTKSKVMAFCCTALSIPFSTMGIGQIYLGKKVEGIVFLVIGLANLFSILLYMPPTLTSIYSINFLTYVLESEGWNLILPLVTLSIHFALIVASFLRVQKLLEVY